MKILVINWQDIRNPFGGGAEVHLHSIFSRIARAGHDVTLHCCSFPGASSEEMIDGIRILREGSRSLFNIVVPRAYLRRFRHERFDVVVDDMNKIPFFTPAYVREPLVGIVHHLFGNTIFREVNPLVGSYVALTESVAVSQFRRRGTPLVAVSESTRDDLAARGCAPENLHVIHNAVDHGRYRPPAGPKSPVPMVGYFGRLKRYKSIDHLLEALPRVVVRVPGLRVVIAGEGEDRARLQRIAAARGLSATVEFTGYVSEAKKVELLQQMWCKVATSAKEGWGLTVLEANACGTPVIASNVPGLRDAVRDGETGFLYPYGDVAALGDRIVQVLSDPPLRERLGAHALSWAGRFTWEQAAEEMLALLINRAQRLG